VIELDYTTMPSDIFNWVQLGFNMSVVLGGPLIGWMLKAIFDRIEKVEQQEARLTTQVHGLAVSLPTNYVGKNDFKDMGDHIFEALRRIEDKLDKKADKKD